MSFWDTFKKAIDNEPDHFKRNSGKKIMAKTTMESEAEIKQEEVGL